MKSSEQKLAPELTFLHSRNTHWLLAVELEAVTPGAVMQRDSKVLWSMVLTTSSSSSSSSSSPSPSSPSSHSILLPRDGGWHGNILCFALFLIQ